jgi:hypothetical protein
VFLALEDWQAVQVWSDTTDQHRVSVEEQMLGSDGAAHVVMRQNKVHLHYKMKQVLSEVEFHGIPR